MSNTVNGQLFIRAAEMIDYFEGTIIARAIEEDLDKQDMDALHMHVSEAEGMAAQQEFEAADVA